MKAEGVLTSVSRKGVDAPLSLEALDHFLLSPELVIRHLSSSFERGTSKETLLSHYPKVTRI